MPLYYRFVEADRSIKQYDENGVLICDEQNNPIYYKNDKDNTFPNTIRIYATQQEAQDAVVFMGKDTVTQHEKYKYSSFDGGNAEFDDKKYNGAWILICRESEETQSFIIPQYTFNAARIKKLITQSHTHKTESSTTTELYPRIKAISSQAFRGQSSKTNGLQEVILHVNNDDTTDSAMVIESQAFAYVSSLKLFRVHTKGNLTLQGSQFVQHNNFDIDISCNKLTWAKSWYQLVTQDNGKEHIRNCTLDIKETATLSNTDPGFLHGLNTTNLYLHNGDANKIFGSYSQDAGKKIGYGARISNIYFCLTPKTSEITVGTACRAYNSVNIDISNPTDIIEGALKLNTNTAFMGTKTLNIQGSSCSDQELLSFFLSNKIHVRPDKSTGLFNSQKYNITINNQPIDFTIDSSFDSIDWDHLSFAYVANKININDYNGTKLHSYQFAYSEIETFNASNSIKLKSIGKKTFAECKKLKQCNIFNMDENGSIGEMAFVNCSNLENLRIGAPITYTNGIYCASLDTKTLEANCLSGCNSITGLYLGPKIKFMRPLALAGLVKVHVLYWDCELSHNFSTLIQKVSETNEYNWDQADSGCGYANKGCLAKMGQEVLNDSGAHIGTIFYIGNHVQNIPDYLTMGKCYTNPDDPIEIYSSVTEYNDNIPYIFEIRPCYRSDDNQLHPDNNTDTQLKTIGVESFLEAKALHLGKKKWRPWKYDPVSYQFLAVEGGQREQLTLSPFNRLQHIKSKAFVNFGVGKMYFKNLYLPSSIEYIDEGAFTLAHARASNGFSSVGILVPNIYYLIFDDAPLSLTKIHTNAFYDYCLHIENNATFLQYFFWNYMLAARDPAFSEGKIPVLAALDAEFRLTNPIEIQSKSSIKVYNHILSYGFNVNNAEQYYLWCIYNTCKILNISNYGPTTGLYDNIMGITNSCFKECKFVTYHGQELVFSLPKALKAVDNYGLAYITFAWVDSKYSAPEESQGLIAEILFNTENEFSLLGEEAIAPQYSLDNVNIRIKYIPKLVKTSLKPFGEVPGYAILDFKDEKAFKYWCFEREVCSPISNSNPFSTSPSWELYIEEEQILGLHFHKSGETISNTPNNCREIVSSKQQIFRPGSLVGAHLETLIIDNADYFQPPQKNNQEGHFFNTSMGNIIIGDYVERTVPPTSFLKHLIYKQSQTSNTAYLNACPFGLGIAKSLETIEYPAYGLSKWWLQGASKKSEKCENIVSYTLSRVEKFETKDKPWSLYWTDNEDDVHLSINADTIKYIHAPSLSLSQDSKGFRDSPIFRFYFSNKSAPSQGGQQFPNLEEIHLYYMGIYIPQECFAYLNKCHTINISSFNTYYILQRAFYNCQALKKIKIPDTIKQVESEAFYNCKALTEVRYIGENATLDNWYKIEFKSVTSTPFYDIDQGTNPLLPQCGLYLKDDTAAQVHIKLVIPNKENFYATSSSGITTMSYDPRPFYNYPIQYLVFTTILDSSLGNIKDAPSIISEELYKQKQDEVNVNNETSTNREFNEIYPENGIQLTELWDKMGSIEIIELAQLDKDYPITDQISAIDSSRIDSQNKIYNINAFTALKYILYIPNETTTNSTIIPENTFSQIESKTQNPIIILIPEDITELHENSFDSCQCLLGAMLANGIDNIINKDDFSVGTTVGTNWRAHPFTQLKFANGSKLNTSLYNKAIRGPISYYNNGKFNFCIGTHVTQEALTPLTDLNLVYSDDVPLQVIDLRSIRVHQGIQHLTLPWIGNYCQPENQDEQQWTPIYDIFSLSNTPSKTMIIQHLTITNNECLKNFNATRSYNHGTITPKAVFTNLDIDTLEIQAPQYNENEQMIIQEEPHFDSHTQSINRVILKMNTVPTRLFHNVDNVKTIGTLICQPYTEQSMTFEQSSMYMPKIQNIIFNMPKVSSASIFDIDTIYQDTTTKTTVPSMIPALLIVEQGAFMSTGLQNDYIYYTGSISDWGISTRFNQTNPLLDATKRFYTSCTIEGDFHISSKTFDNTLKPYQVAVETNPVTQKYNIYCMVNNYAFAGNHFLNSVDCTWDSTYGDVDIDSVIIQDINDTMSIAPFNNSNALIELFSGVDNITIGAQVNRLDQFKPNLTESEVVPKIYAN